MAGLNDCGHGHAVCYWHRYAAMARLLIPGRLSPQARNPRAALRRRRSAFPTWVCKGMMFRVEQVTEVYAYCDAKDRACRGVALTLRDCELTDALIIVEERDITAHLDPT